MPPRRADKRKVPTTWDSTEAEQKHKQRQRRHTLDEDQLFKLDSYGGQFPTVFSQEESWISQRDSTGLVNKSHLLTRINQDSTGRVVKEFKEERWDPHYPEKNPVVTTDVEETQLHQPDLLHKQLKGK